MGLKRKLNIPNTGSYKKIPSFAVVSVHWFKDMRHIEMPKAAPKSPFVIFKN